jgi:hypothetical protein
MAQVQVPDPTAVAQAGAGGNGEANSLEDFLWQVHGYTNEYIRFADTKAAFIAAATSALIGTSISSSVLDSFLLKTPCLWYRSQWLALIGLLMLSLSTICSLAVVWPRLWNKTPVGFIFWESIAGHRSAANFSQGIHKATGQERTTAIAEHLFILGSVARRKYLYVKYALWLGVPGGGLTVTALFLQHGLKP